MSNNQSENSKNKNEKSIRATSNPHEGHRERLRNRFINDGLSNFEPHQVLELLLFFTIPMKDTNPIAHELIKNFGSLTGVFEANTADLMKINGISQRSAVFLSLVSSVTSYFSKLQHGEKPIIDSSSKAGNFVLSLYSNEKNETFFIICLDSQNRVNWCGPIFEGTTNEAAIYPRKIIEIALRHNAVSIIVSHNHPGGSLKASSSDINATKNIKAALDTIQIKLIDHIIVGGNEYLSFAEKGLL